MIKTRDHAKLLLNDLVGGPEDSVKALLNLLKSKYATQDIAMIIHHLNVAIAEREKRHRD